MSFEAKESLKRWAPVFFLTLLWLIRVGRRENIGQCGWFAVKVKTQVLVVPVQYRSGAVRRYDPLTAPHSTPMSLQAQP